MDPQSDAARATMDPPQQQLNRSAQKPPQVQVQPVTVSATATVAQPQRRSSKRSGRGAAAAQLQAEADAQAVLSKQRQAAAVADVQAANAAKRKRSKLIAKRSAKKLRSATARAQGEGDMPPRFVVHAAADCIATDDDILAQHDAANASTFKSPSRKSGKLRRPELPELLSSSSSAAMSPLIAHAINPSAALPFSTSTPTPMPTPTPTPRENKRQKSPAVPQASPLRNAAISKEAKSSKKKMKAKKEPDMPTPPPPARLTYRMRWTLAHRPRRKRLEKVTDTIPNSPPRSPPKTEQEQYDWRMRCHRRSMRRQSLEQRIQRRENKAQRIANGIVDEDLDFDDERMGIIAGDDGMNFDRTDSDPGWTDDNVSPHESDDLDEDGDDDEEAMEKWKTEVANTNGGGAAAEVVRIHVDDDDDEDNDDPEIDDEDEDDSGSELSEEEDDDVDEDDDDDDDDYSDEESENNSSSDSDDGSNASNKSLAYSPLSPPPGDSSGYNTPASPSISVIARNLKAKKANEEKKEKAKETGRQDERAPGGMLAPRLAIAGILAEDVRKQAEKIEKNNAMHDARVIALSESGFNTKESIEALKATKEDGLESTQRAANWLRAVSTTPMINMAKAIGKVQQTQGYQKGQLAAQGQRSQYGPRVCDLVTKAPAIKQMCIDIQHVHDMNDFGHASTLSGSLKTLYKSLVDRKLHHQHKATEEICQAVCEDCAKCRENHAKQRQDVEQEMRRIAAREAITAPKPWDIGDSKRDKTLRRGFCSTCNRGSMNAQPGEKWDARHWLYYCMDCKQGWHEHCAGFKQLKEWTDEKGKDGFLCIPCHLKRHRREEARHEATLVHSPRQMTSKWDQEAPARKPRKATKWDDEGSASGGGGAARERQLGRRRGATPDEPTTQPNTNTDSSAGSQNATIQLLGAHATSTNVKLNPYIMWEEACAVTVKG